MNENIDNDACVLCNRSYSTVIENCEGGYQVLKCSECGLVYVDPIPTKELLAKAYFAEYYTPWFGKQRKKRKKMWKTRLRTLNSFSEEKGKLLDVG